MRYLLILIMEMVFLAGCSAKTSNKKPDVYQDSTKIKEINVYLAPVNMTGRVNTENTSPVFYALAGNKMYKLKAIDKNKRDTLAYTVLESDIKNDSNLPESCFNALNEYGLNSDGNIFEITITLNSGRFGGFNVTELSDEIVPKELKPIMKKIKKGARELGAL